jgi:ankyrin repeat protein
MEKGLDGIFDMLALSGISTSMRLTVKPNITILIGAVINKNVHVVRRLCQLGANPNTSDANWETPLHYNFKQNPYTKEDVEIARILLEEGADPLSENKRGFNVTALADNDIKSSLLEGYEISAVINQVIEQKQAVEPSIEPSVPDLLPNLPQLKNHLKNQEYNNYYIVYLNTY